MPLNYNPSAMDLGGTLQLRGNWRVRNYPEAASGDFDAGEVVILSGDSVTQSHAAPGAATFSAALADDVKILGVALADANGTTGHIVPVAIPMDSSAELLLRIGSTSTGSNQEVQDVGLGDLATCIRYQTSAATGTRGRTCIGPAPGGSGTDKFVVRQKYSYLYAGGNAADQAAGDDFGLVWVGFIADDTVMNRAVVP